MAAIIIFLIWMRIPNIAILLGLEFNAELEPNRAIESGHPPGAEPYVEPRDRRKLRTAPMGQCLLELAEPECTGQAVRGAVEPLHGAGEPPL